MALMRSHPRSGALMPHSARADNYSRVLKRKDPLRVSLLAHLAPLFFIR
jgi:hypothetical protein